jgi:hypothetical protein
MLYSRCSLHDPKHAKTAQRIERRPTDLPSFKLAERLTGMSRTRPALSDKFPMTIKRNAETKEKRHA